MSYSAPILLGIASLKWDAAVFVNSYREWWGWWMVWWGLCLLAYLTNPTQATFRTHLTSLSFHTHLQRLSNPSPSPHHTTASQPERSSATGSSIPMSVDGIYNGGTGRFSKTAPHPSQPRHHPPSQQPSNVLSFSNRITLSVRTPPLVFRSYFFFSTVILSSRSSTSTLAATTQMAKSPKSHHPVSPTPHFSSSTKQSVHEKGGIVLATNKRVEKLTEGEAEIWLGAFGTWFALKSSSDEDIETEERLGRLERGVLNLQVEDDDSDAYEVDLPSSLNADTENDLVKNNQSQSSTSKISSSSSSSSRGPRSTKRLFRAGQRRSSPTSLARLKAKVESSSSLPAPLPSAHGFTGTASSLPSDTSSISTNVPSQEGIEIISTVTSTPSLPLRHQEIGGQGFYATNTSKNGLLTESNLHELKQISVIPQPTQNTTVDERRADFHSLNDLSTDTTAAAPEPSPTSDPVIAELHTQLEELRTAAAENEKRLQDDLEALRKRKKEEDAFRAELKSKTKGLEEQKMTAGLKRAEAERELAERKSDLKRVSERVTKIKTETEILERKEAEVMERKERKKRDRKEREKKLKDDVAKKKAELAEYPSDVGSLVKQVENLGKAVEERKQLLQMKKNGLAARHASSTFSSGQYHRRAPVISGASSYGYSNSRPTSVRSGQQQYQSAPSSPVLQNFSMPNEVPPPIFHGSAPPSGLQYRAPPLPQPGFMEHRMQHRRNDLNDSLPHFNADSSGAERHRSFLPFDFDVAPHPKPSLAGRSSADSADELTHRQNRPQLSLPLQYLDSGLLDSGETPSVTGPLSPMTPHQASLIPSQLFHMLDEDDDDDAKFLTPESPTRYTSGAMTGLGDMWSGSGLNKTDLVDNREPEHNGPVRRKSSLSPGVTSFMNTTESPLRSPVSDISSGTGMNGYESEKHESFSQVWDNFDNGNRISPHFGEPDALSRQGLSLNPGAKAFAFQPRLRSGSGSSSVFGPEVVRARDFAKVGAEQHSSASSTAGSSSLAFISAIGPPPKSRMEFSSSHHQSDVATSSSSLNPTGAASGSPPATSRFSFDWKRVSPKGASSSVISGLSVIPSTSPAAVGRFNPFQDDEDSSAKSVAK